MNPNDIVMRSRSDHGSTFDLVALSYGPVVPQIQFIDRKLNWNEAMKYYYYTVSPCKHIPLVEINECLHGIAVQFFFF